MPAIKDEGTGTKININGVIEGTVNLSGNNGNLNINETADVHNLFDWVIKVSGTNNTTDIKGSAVGGYGGILVDSDSSTITINGGTVKGAGRTTSSLPNLISPAILAKNAKDITVNSGTVSGELGIVAYNGNININGGTISGTNEDESKTKIYYALRNPAGDYPESNGASVIVDNEILGGNAKATITTGTFNAISGNSLVSKTNNASDFRVSGGIYNKVFNQEFVVPGKLELSITKQDNQLWYVGTDATTSVESSKNDNTAIIDVIQGDLTLEYAAEGLTVKNSGNGVVKANGVAVATGEQIIVTKQQENVDPGDGNNPNNPENNEETNNVGQNAENTNTDENNNQQNNTQNANDSNVASNPFTGDNLFAYIILFIISIIGIGTAVYLKNRFE